MSYGRLETQTDYVLSRDSAFSYKCAACSRCCHRKAIRVGPYELLRLARHLGMTTTDFIAQHTEAGGTILRTQTENDQACIFLTERGCGVHPARPTACRIYPLARWTKADGDEVFAQLAPELNSAGLSGISATVADYLSQQGLQPYFEMSDRYGALYARMLDHLAEVDAEEGERLSERREEVDEIEAGESLTNLIDIDQTLANYCDVTGLAKPDLHDFEATVAMHIEALDYWLDQERSAAAE